MLFDGIYELINGRYYGPENPGAWADLVGSFGINIYALSPVFIIWGIGWLYFVYMLWTKRRRAFPIGLLVCVLTLWYLPVGAIISFIVFCLLLSNKQSSGLLYTPRSR